MIHLQKAEITPLAQSGIAIIITWQCTLRLMECNRPLRKSRRLKKNTRWMQFVSRMWFQRWMQCLSPAFRQRCTRRQKRTRLQHQRNGMWHTDSTSQSCQGQKEWPPTWEEQRSQETSQELPCLEGQLPQPPPACVSESKNRRMLPHHQHYLSGTKAEWGQL